MTYLHKIKPGRVVEKWECEFEAELKKWKANKSPEWLLIRDMDEKRPFKLSEKQIIAGIENGTIFGIAEVDIYTPNHLKEKFSEMTAIFKHAEISRDDVGEFMREYAEEHDLLKKPTKSLIGSHFAKNYCVSTPLLQWYLKQGLVVEKTHLVIEYEPKKCFDWFLDHVSDMRRRGDDHSLSAILSNGAKLKGKMISVRFELTYTRYKHDALTTCAN